MKRILLILLFVGGCGGMPPADSVPAGQSANLVGDATDESIADVSLPATSSDDSTDAPEAPSTDTIDETDVPVTPLPSGACPDGSLKTEPGLCGCDVADVDSDFDGTPDCRDECPGDPFKVSFGACGCGAFDDDFDQDGFADFCLDNCPLTFNPDQLDSDQDGIGDACSVVVVTVKLVLFADDGQFLGVVSDNPFDLDSIANQLGTYGSVLSPLSIWNRLGMYGSTLSSLSPWNTFTRIPPLLFEDTGTFVAFITANSFLLPAIHPNDLAIIVGRTDVLR